MISPNVNGQLTVIMLTDYNKALDYLLEPEAHIWDVTESRLPQILNRFLRNGYQQIMVDSEDKMYQLSDYLQQIQSSHNPQT